jgi:Recombinase zinc beta ribbon domain
MARYGWNRRTALVSEADFIAVQDTAAPRGPAGPAVRRYLLAGLIACGRCGRRLESCWSYGRPAYRCRHGYTSATAPDPARPKNTYVREDQILPHLAALAILLAVPAGKPARRSRVRAQLTRPADTAALIGQLHADGTVLTYDPDDRTLRADGRDAPPCNHRHGPRRHPRAGTGKGGPPREKRQREHTPQQCRAGCSAAGLRGPARATFRDEHRDARAGRRSARKHLRRCRTSRSLIQRPLAPADRPGLTARVMAGAAEGS